MTPEIIFNIGIIVCITIAIGAIIAAMILYFYKIRLNKQLDAEFGKRRH